MNARRRHHTLRRLGWFAGLWAAGVVVLAALGYGLRTLLGL